MMANWREIVEYRDFYDFPRIFIIKNKLDFILFDCEFDKEREDFSDHFRLYKVPEFFLEVKDWRQFSEYEKTFLGSIPTKELTFDESKREQVDFSFFDF